jgi:hypothetical protein
MIHNCYTCDYGNIRYDKLGMIIGVDCSADNMRYIPAMDIKMNGACPKWVERDDHERLHRS